MKVSGKVGETLSGWGGWGWGVAGVSVCQLSLTSLNQATRWTDAERTGRSLSWLRLRQSGFDETSWHWELTGHCGSMVHVSDDSLTLSHTYRHAHTNTQQARKSKLEGTHFFIPELFWAWQFVINGGNSSWQLAYSLLLEISTVSHRFHQQIKVTHI